jgi:hypothetical protein
VLASRRPDGTVGPPRRGRQHFFATGNPAEIADRASHGSRQMLRVAAVVLAIAAALLAGGLW